jgi:hypothetical protein
MHKNSASSLPPIEVLYRLRKQRPDVFNKLEGKYPTNPGLTLTSKQCTLMVRDMLIYMSDSTNFGRGSISWNW